MKTIYCLLLLSACGQNLTGEESASSRKSEPSLAPEYIAGPKGEPGEQGPKGDTGDDGEDYTEETLAANCWRDPIDDTLWMIGTTPTANQITTATVTICAAPWSLPSKAQATSAIFHGILGVASTFWDTGALWTSEFQINGERYAITSGGVVTVPAVSGTAGIACIKGETP